MTGSNLYFDGTGAALETMRGLRLDETLLAAWRTRIDTVRHALRWPPAEIVVRRHASGASLAFAAPLDQLYTAAEANEWAWLASLHALRPDVAASHWHAPGHAAAWARDSALQTLRAMAAEEANPALIALLDAAQARGVPAHADDDALSIGEGVGSRTWPARALPAIDQVPWAELHGIPLAVVTGSNGKTTTVRLLAAMARAQGWNSAYSSTDGLFVGAQRVDSGDYSGPVGARTVLRQPTVDAAILETARGGLLRRGIAIHNARAAVVTNISPDHFGEYGIHDLADLAEVKLTVIRSLAADGLLVLNADDPLLLRCAETITRRIGWFALDHDHPQLLAHRHDGGMTCGVRDGRLRLSMAAVRHAVEQHALGQHALGQHALEQHAVVEYDLGAVAAMPITLAGSATYNIANAAAAALAASALGVAADRIGEVLARFGARPGDNPGRLQRWRYGGMRNDSLRNDSLQVFLDYAHNPDGLRGLLQVASAARGEGRLGLILGQAGNRENADIRALAAVAAGFRPDRVWLKDIGGEYMRGRAAGEIADILRDELLQQGLPASALVVCLEETASARDALRWAQSGDVLVLPIHNPEARDEIVALLDRLHARHWRVGVPLADLEMRSGTVGSEMAGSDAADHGEALG